MTHPQHWPHFHVFSGIEFDLGFDFDVPQKFDVSTFLPIYTRGQKSFYDWVRCAHGKFRLNNSQWNSEKSSYWACASYGFVLHELLLSDPCVGVIVHCCSVRHDWHPRNWCWMKQDVLSVGTAGLLNSSSQVLIELSKKSIRRSFNELPWNFCLRCIKDLCSRAYRIGH